MSFAGLILLVQSVLALAEPWRWPGVLWLSLLLGLAPCLITLIRVRQLLLQGARQSDLVQALRTEADREARQVTGVDAGLGWKRPLLRWSAITAVASAFVWLLPVEPYHRGPLFLLNLVSVASTVVLADQVRRPTRARDRARFWNGALAGRLFHLAAATIGRRSVHRTWDHGEVTLAASVQALFDRLPAESRRSLGDLDHVLERLRLEATDLRRRRQEIAAIRASHPDSEIAAGLAGADQSLERRLTQVLSVLERLQRSLLRLHGGNLASGEASTGLAEASALADSLVRRAEGQEEIASLLTSPGDR